MYLPTAIAAAAAFSRCTYASPLLPQTRDVEPCQQVREDADAWMLENNIVPRNLTVMEELLGESPVPLVPVRPSLAYACLKSIPLDKATALGQLDVLRPFVEWQSTLDYLRAPPKGYLSEGVDLVRGLDEIQAKLEKQNTPYKSGFDFLADLYILTSVRVRDAHFHYSSLLMDLFSFQLGVEFISISKDGVSKPDIFLYSDLNHDKNGYKPSPVSTINGVPAQEFLSKASVHDGTSHDPDARMNNLFPNVANRATTLPVNSNPFALNLPDTTTVKLKNGTKLEFTNAALFRANFTNISSGSDLFEQYGRGNGTGQDPIALDVIHMSQLNYTASWKGYPEPLFSNRISAGFLFNDTTQKPLSDVAVLAVNTFYWPISPHDTDISFDSYFGAFHNRVSDFLKSAKQANKTKLILDLQSNAGGIIGNLLSLYFSLFPNKLEIFPALWQIRAHPQFKFYGQELFNESDPTRLPFDLQNNLQVRPGPDGINSNWSLWDSFEEYYGPVKGWKERGEYTRPSLLRTDISLHFGGFDFKPPFDEPPFKPEDIVIVTDGECASACAILTDALVNVHGVRTVAMGGRPIEAPMQAIGQVKGGPIDVADAFARKRAELDESNLPEGVTLLPHVNETLPLRVTFDNRLMGWAKSMSVNRANIIPWDSPGGGEGAIPYQMLYEAANCKLFYTWEMSREIVHVWRAVAEVVWNGGKCVMGSTTEKDGRIGGLPEYTSKVEDKYSLGPGPGALKK